MPGDNDIINTISDQELTAFFGDIIEGFDPNFITDFPSDKLLHVLARCYDKNYESIIEELVNKGVNLNVSNSAGFTALHIAVAYCNSDLVEFLVKKGAELDVQCNYKRYTPLFLALDRIVYVIKKCDNNNEEVIDKLLSIIMVLIDYGANVNIKDYKGNTIAHFLLKSINYDSYKFLEKKSYKKELNIQETLFYRICKEPVDKSYVSKENHIDFYIQMLSELVSARGKQILEEKDARNNTVIEILKKFSIAGMIIKSYDEGQRKYKPKFIKENFLEKILSGTRNIDMSKENDNGRSI